MEEQKESVLNNYPNIISYDCSKKIIEQMERNICKINIGEEQGTGFFCKIPFPDLNNRLSVFITNNHILYTDYLYKNNSTISLNVKNKKEEILLNLNDRLK